MINDRRSNQKNGTKSVELLARTIHGIEWVGAAEIEGHLNADVIEQGHREIRFQMKRLDSKILELGSIDDAFLIAAELRNIGHTRASLNVLASQAAAVDFDAQLSLLNKIRGIPQKPSFAVVASFLGRRNYNRFEIEESVAASVMTKTRWRYLAKEIEVNERANILLRVHLREDSGFIGIRLSSTPLHRRQYKLESRTGTLHPPVAYAMALLAGVHEGSILLDPCCGVGTIPIEALSLEPRAHALGSDIDLETLRKAAANALEASQPVVFFAADAARLPFEDASIDRIVSNPPWGRVVRARGLLKDDAVFLLREISRVLRSEGRAAFIAERDIFDKIDPSSFGLKTVASVPISLFGAWPGIFLLVPRQTTNSNFIDVDGRLGKELLKFWRNKMKETADIPSQISDK